jgi:hypothetical protein
LNNIKLPKNKDNDIILETFYNKIENSIGNENEISFYYKFLIILILMFHQNDNVPSPNYSIENLSYLFYSNFILIYNKFDCKNLGMINMIGNNEDLIVNHILKNLNIKNVDFYESIIMCYAKYKLSLDNKNLLNLIINKLIKFFELESDDKDLTMIYNEFLIGSKEIKDKINKKLL